MNKKLQIFVSSTYTDLIEERQAAVEAVLDAGHIPAGMELFKAGNRSQLETIYNWIDESDIYMLILGGRYGTLELESQKSYTQLEYEYALSKNMPFFAIILSEKFLVSKINLIGLTKAMEQKYAYKYADFKSLVMSKIIREVDDCKDLKIAIYSTLNEYINDCELTSWVRSNEISDYLKSENIFLTQKITELNKQIHQLKNQLSQYQFDYNYFNELIDILKNKHYYWNVFNHNLNNALAYFICYYNVFCSYGNSLALTEKDISVFLEKYDLVKQYDDSFMVTKTGKLFYAKLNELKFPAQFL